MFIFYRNAGLLKFYGALGLLVGCDIITLGHVYLKLMLKCVTRVSSAQ